MRKIQNKIWVLVMIAVAIMGAIWLALTHVMEENQTQSNEMLKRYMEINAMTQQTSQLITSLNAQIVEPSTPHRDVAYTHIDRIQNVQQHVLQLKNAENAFDIMNYSHLLASLTDTSTRILNLIDEQEMEEANREFKEANRIANYVSDTTLTLLSSELTTYDEVYRNLIERSQALNQLAFIVLCWITAVLLLGTYWFSATLTKPVKQLTTAANALAQGKFDTTIDVHSKDELAFLAQTFDYMRKSINRSIDELQQKAQLEQELQQSQLLLKESQLKSLQNQVNPHFLFNALNTLSKKAYLDGAEETSDLLIDVAGLLRYNLKNSDQAVKLADEITVSQQYMQIQQARFSDRLQFEVDIDQRLTDVMMPSFTLQPLIENAVIHGIEPKEEGGTVTLKVALHDGSVQIEIHDDGLGMHAQQIAALWQADPQEHIGFANVAMRLTLFFGRSDLMDIQSEVGKGTTIHIDIPWEEAEYAYFNR